MNYNPEDIDEYLNGEMDEATQSAFELQLQEDAALQQELSLQKTLRAGIKDKGNQLLKEKLKAIHKEEIGGKTNSTVVPLYKRFPILAAAASIALLIAIYFFFFRSSPTGDQLFAANYEPYQIGLVQRGDQQEALTQADQLYRAGSFDQAVPVLESILDADPNLPKVRMALAISYLETNQDTLAQEQLNQVYDNPLYADKAQWYLSLIYLKNGQEEQAKSELEKLVQDENSNYQPRAKQLLQHLK